MTSGLTVYLPWISIAIIVALFHYGYTLRTLSRRLPPGPRPLPFIGNALDIPRKNLGPEFQRISQRYGE